MLTVPNPLAASARARPEHAALVFGDTAWTAAALTLAVRRLAQSLIAAGLRPKHTVLLPAHINDDTVIALHAIGWAGATVLLMPPDISEEALRYKLEAAPADFSLLTAPFDCTHDCNLPTALPTTMADAPAVERPWPLDEPRFVLFTSGTTGAPTPVTLTTSQLLFSATGSAFRLGHSPDDQWLCALPLHHTGGLSILLRCAWYGTTVLLYDKPDAHALARALDDGQHHGAATQVSLVPTQLARLLDVWGERPGPQALRFVLLGGAPCGQSTLDSARSLGFQVVQTWGMTETASQVATAFVGETGDALPVMPFATVRADSSRLIVEGPIAGGSVVTSDLGSVGADGRVKVQGRADDTIITGGENVAPQWIEALLFQHANVHDVTVVGVPHEHWGEQVVACVIPKGPQGTDHLEASLRSLCAEYSHAAPKRYLFVDTLPHTNLEKRDRASVRRALDTWVRSAGQSQASAHQGIEKLLGNVAGLEGFEVNDGVGEKDARAQDAILTDNAIGKSHGLAADAVEFNLNDETLTNMGRGPKVALGPDHGGAPSALSEEGLEVTTGGSQQFLVGDMTVLEKAPKEGYSGAVDLKKPDGKSVLKGHIASRQCNRN